LAEFDSVEVGTRVVGKWLLPRMLVGPDTPSHIAIANWYSAGLYLLSCWYTKFEVAKRYSVFYFVGSIASALSGILAYGLQQMEGVQGIRGWRW
jgi:hypothetical protein